MRLDRRILRKKEFELVGHSEQFEAMMGYASSHCAVRKPIAQEEEGTHFHGHKFAGSSHVTNKTKWIANVH